MSISINKDLLRAFHKMLRKMRTFKIQANNELHSYSSLHYFSRVSWISNRLSHPPPGKLARVSHVDCLITNPRLWQ